MSLETTLSTNDRLKLKNVVEEGLKVTQEVADLKEGLRDTVKAVAEELSIPVKDLNKAIRAAFKSSIDAEKESVDNVEEILHLVGRR